MNEIKNLYNFYKNQSEKYADKKLFNNKLSYAEAWQLVLSRAAFLQQEGYKKGDVIAILAENSYEWAVTYMAITSIGAIVLTLDTNLQEENYHDMLTYADACAIFISKTFDYNFKQKKYEISLSTNLGDAKNFKETGLEKIGPADISTMIFTSGTTGNPKVAQLTQKNIYSTAFAAAIHISAKDGCFNFLSLLPLYHVLGLIPTFICAIGCGGNVMFQPSLKGPDIINSLKEIQIHVFTVVPQILELFMDGILEKVKAASKAKYKILFFFLNHANKFRKIGLGFIPAKIFKPVYDIFGKDFYCFICGGAALKKKYFRYYDNIGLKVVEGYGLTETTGPIIGNTPFHIKPHSIGFPTPGMEAEIRNKRLDGIGEIWVRGDSLMPGYYKNEEANKEAFDEQGWFNTGDLGSQDRAGNFYVKGRLKNVIVLPSGKNVYPEELEAYYQKSPLIKEISVFGYKINGSENVYAVIVPEKPAEDSFDQIKKELETLNKGLPSYKVVTHFAVSFEPLPRTTTKKIVVRKVIKLLEKNQYQTKQQDKKFTRHEITESSSPAQKIVAAIKEKLKISKLYEDQTLSDLDVDSLKTIDLTSFLEERFNISIKIADLIKQKNFKEIIAYLSSCRKKDKETKILDKEILEGEITNKVRTFYNPVIDLGLLLLKLFAKIAWRLKVTNKQYINSIENNILIANHQSNLDILWILCSLPAKVRRNVYLLGKKELSFFKYLFPGINMIFVERFGNVVPALKAGADILNQGKSLFIFPEGTRTKTGELSEFKSGAAYLAKNLNKEIVPIVIKGAYHIYSRNTLLPKFFTRTRGEVIFTEKISPAKFKTVEELNQALEKTIKEQLK